MPKNDLIRFGVYTQMNGYFSIRDGHYRFRYVRDSIDDIYDLIVRVSGKRPFSTNNGKIEINSKKLLQDLNSIGFIRFSNKNWNIPNIANFTEDEVTEYIRAVIDSIGYVDSRVDNKWFRKVVYIKSFSPGMIELSKVLNRKLYKNKEGRYCIEYNGKDAIEILDRLDWKFHKEIHKRGAEMIKRVHWEEFI